MIELRRIRRQANEPEAIHIVLTAGDKQRHVKFKRSRNPVMYDFITENAAIPTDTQPDSDPETASN